MRRTFPLAKRFVLLVFVPVGCIVLAGLFALRQGLPPNRTESGTILPAGSKIVRDANGVAFVTSKSDLDAFFSLGVAHAQDRMWQLEVQRRMASGRLSEIFGSKAIQQDTWMRTLGLYEAARASLPSLSDEARRSLDAYANGVNAWIESNSVLPVEFLIFNVRPEPWTSVDSLAWAKVFALSLGLNMRLEVRNYLARQYLTGPQFAEITNSRHREVGNVHIGERKGEVEDVEMNVNLSEAIIRLLRINDGLANGEKSVGSNAWAVAARCTNSGNSILANDPHLGLQIPSLWYVADLNGDRLHSAGMTLVGLPLVIFGRNESIAWGGTNLMADTQDLFVVDTNPDNPAQYRNNGSWASFEDREEVIRIAGDFPGFLRVPRPPITLRVRRTNYGPIVTENFTSVDHPIALRWTALDAGDTTYEAFFRLNYAADWNSFNLALRALVAPALNMIYADRKGNVGHLGVGRIPVRKQKIAAQVPVSSANGSYEWTGYIPYEEMPKSYNPSSCYVVSANDKPVDDNYPYFITNDWSDPVRAERIRELLDDRIEKKAPVDAQFVMQMQRDLSDSVAYKLSRLLTTVGASTQHTSELEYVKRWDGNMAAESQAATIYQVWVRHIKANLFGRDIRAYWNKAQDSAQLNLFIESVSDRKVHYALESSRNWCVRTPDEGALPSCSAVVETSLDEAVTELNKIFGSRLSAWRWGNLQNSIYEHRPFSSWGQLSRVFERRQSSGGSENTINVSHATYTESNGYEKRVGATFRQVIELGPNGSKHFYMNSTGQSGNVLSGHYDDMVGPFQSGRYFDLIPQETSDQATRPTG